MEAPELVGLPRIAYIGVLAKDPSDELNYNVRIPPYTYLHDVTRGGRQLEVRRPLEACHSGHGVCPFLA